MVWRGLYPKSPGFATRKQRGGPRRTPCARRKGRRRDGRGKGRGATRPDRMERVAGKEGGAGRCGDGAYQYIREQARMASLTAACAQGVERPIRRLRGVAGVKNRPGMLSRGAGGAPGSKAWRGLLENVKIA